MSESAIETGTNTELRDMAEALLKTGTAKKAGNYSLGLDALNLLHRLSSDPDSASDALKLLHELQVHQVEIDLQNETIQSEERRLSDELSHYRELYHSAPAGYFVVDFQGKLIKANQAGAQLLGMKDGNLDASHIDHFLAPDSRTAMAAMLERLHQGDSALTCDVSTTGNSSPRHLRVMANLSPDKGSALLVCCEVS